MPLPADAAEARQVLLQRQFRGEPTIIQRIWHAYSYEFDPFGDFLEKTCFDAQNAARFWLSPIASRYRNG